MPDLQLRIVRRGGLTLCCKGGHNGESHNHNDVGSFVLYADGEPEVVDAGNMVYTARTFSDQRYTLWNVRAAYHNVPMIGETEQRDGAEYASRDVRCLPDGLALDMAGAYPAEAGVRFLKRELLLSDAALTVRDGIGLDRPGPVTWVFMLRDRPRLEGRNLVAGRICLAVPDGLEIAIEEIPITDSRMAKNYPGSLWRVKLLAPCGTVFDTTWRFERI